MWTTSTTAPCPPAGPYPPCPQRARHPGAYQRGDSLLRGDGPWTGGGLWTGGSTGTGGSQQSRGRGVPPDRRESGPSLNQSFPDLPKTGGLYKLPSFSSLCSYFNHLERLNQSCILARTTKYQVWIVVTSVTGSERKGHLKPSADDWSWLQRFCLKLVKMRPDFGLVQEPEQI